MVRVTHRFHPLFGREFPFVKRHRTWDHDRVYFTGDGGALLSLPVEWTQLGVVFGAPFNIVRNGHHRRAGRDRQRFTVRSC